MRRWNRVGIALLAFVLFPASACQIMDPVIRRTTTPVPEWVSSPREYTTPVSLFDDFSDPTSGWEIGDYSVGSVGYAEGEYFVRVEDKDVFTWGQQFEYFGDVTIEVTARQASGPENNNTGYGVMCRVNYDAEVGELEGYAFLVSADGYYVITRYVSGNSSNLDGWNVSNAVRQGSGSNQLQVICEGERLLFYLNGVRVAETWDDSFSSGDVALIGTTYESGAAEFRFDNFSLSTP